MNKSSNHATNSHVSAASTIERVAPPDKFRLTVIIPTYNEVANLRAIVDAVMALPIAGLQVLVVDDNSPDGTGEVADELALEWNAGQGLDERPRFVVLHRTGKGGLGTAYVAGMTWALDHGAEYILQMDADFSHSPAYVPQMLGVMQSMDADVVIGSRYVPGGSLDAGWGRWRRFVSWWANLYSRAILGLRIRDMTAGFKLWRRTALQQIGLEKIQSNGYSFQVEMAYLCERLGFRIVEIPIHFEDRRIGQSKLDIPVKLESAWRTWQIRWRYRRLPARAAQLSTSAYADSPLAESLTGDPSPSLRDTASGAASTLDGSGTSSTVQPAPGKTY